MTKYTHHNENWFNGQPISDCGKEHGFVDYKALASGFNHILNNTVIGAVDDWEVVNGSEFFDEGFELDGTTEEYIEFFQYYIIDANGAQVLEDCTNETVYYSNTLDMYVWAIDHFGTSWDYVLTEIPIVTEK